MSGHGWVTPNSGGFKAHCGGPGLCSECSQEAFELERKQEKTSLDFQHNVIDSLAPLIGWEIIALERHKHGVVRYHARRFLMGKCEFQIGYAKDEVFAVLQLPQ